MRKIAIVLVLFQLTSCAKQSSFIIKTSEVL